MNEDTLVVVCGYGESLDPARDKNVPIWVDVGNLDDEAPGFVHPASDPESLRAINFFGDAWTIKNNFDCYIHHKCPVLILSPEDAPVKVSLDGAMFRNAGKRAYVGQDSIDRQKAFLRILWEYPQNFFLVNDSDSLCLSPEIPKHLYTAPSDIFWSNECLSSSPSKPPLPMIALVPPYFFTRQSLSRMLAVIDNVPMNPEIPFIEHWMLQLVYASGIRHKGFLYGSNFKFYREGFEVVRNNVRNHGTVFIHPVKHPGILNTLKEDREYYLRVNSI